MMSLAEQTAPESETAATDQPDVAEAYDAHGRAVYNLCLRMTGRHSIAEEITQETFLRLMGRADSLRNPEKIRGWLFRTASNLAISRSRRMKVWTRIQDWLGATPRPEPLDAAVADEVQRALMKLPEGYRSVLVLHDVAGMTHREIAEARGCKPGTAKSQLFHARLKLAELLKEEGQ
jgi:RNA polymerase sigma-70 factor (ECF subfamily)